MIIGYTEFPIYSLFILLSLIFNIIFNFFYLKKKKIERKYIFLSIFMNIVFCIICAKMITLFMNKNSDLNIVTAGFTSYGGALGILLGSYLFYKMTDKRIIIESNILSLPLMYSISKLGCFFAGCCYGIPYNGILNVTYTQGLNISLVPIQLIESIIFLCIFIISYIFKERKYSIEFLLIVSAVAKFILEYFRYSNIGKVLCSNQIISLLVIVVTILFCIIKTKKAKQNV